MQVVLGLGDACGLEVHDQSKLVVFPYLVVAVQVGVHEHRRVQIRQRGVCPVAPPQHGSLLIKAHPPAESGPHNSRVRPAVLRGAVAPTAACTWPLVAGWCNAARKAASCLAARSRSMVLTTSNRVAPATRRVTSITGVQAAGDDLGKERDVGATGQRGQDADLMGDPPRHLT